MYSKNILKHGYTINPVKAFENHILKALSHNKKHFDVNKTNSSKCDHL